MLSSDQIAELAAALCATAETLGQTLSANAAELMAEDLAEYDATKLSEALRACRREVTGRLTLADIVKRLDANDGRPGKDEAWAIALESSDEALTVMMTDEIRAATSASQPILAAGDKVGARMAFMSAYERHVSAARRSNKPVNWSASLGFDPSHRRVAIENAVNAGLLDGPKAAQEIERLGLDAPVTQDGQAIAGLLTGTVAKPSPHVREKLREIKRQLAESSRLKREQAEREAEERAEEYAKRREDAQRFAESLEPKP